MAGFGGGYGDAHGFRVAHFTYDDDVWSLTKGGAQSGGKIGSVGADFDLFDDAAHVVMLVLDGIFNDDNVAGFAMIDFVDERSHGGGFAGAGSAAEENESAGKLAKIFYSWREMQFLERRDFVGQRANGRGGAGTFAMEIDAEAAESVDAIGRIGNTVFAETIQSVGGKRGEDGFFDFRAIENAGRDLADFAVDTDTGRRAFDEQQVAAATINQAGEPTVESCGESGIIGGRSVRTGQRTRDFVEVGEIIHSNTKVTAASKRGQVSVPQKQESGLQKDIPRGGWFVSLRERNNNTTR